MADQLPPEANGFLAALGAVVLAFTGWGGWRYFRPRETTVTAAEDKVFTVKLAQEDHDLLRDLKQHAETQTVASEKIFNKLEDLREGQIRAEERRSAR